MANRKHLRILRKGVEVWNLWRQANRRIEPNLSGADFSGADFSGADFSGADFSRADFSGAILTGTDLSKAVLIEADLSWANLTWVKLTWADLSETNLSGVDFIGADLMGANFTGVDLKGIDFSRMNLTEACFQNANLRTARLINAKLDGANLTDASLWETQRAGWSIRGVICESVYWDEKAEKKSIYAEGEFEKLFADLTKIQLSYKGGMSLLEVATIPSLIQHLANSFPDCTLRFVSMHTDTGGAVVELVVEDVDDLSKEQVKQLQADLEKEAQQQVEYQRKALKEREKRLELEGEVKQLSIVVDKLINRPNFAIQSIEDFKMSDEKGSKYINKGQVGAMGDNAHAHHMTFNQTVNNTGESLDLVALATELATLRIAIAKMQDSSPQAMIAAGEITRAEIAAGEKDESKVKGHLKAAGQWGLDAATKVGTSVVAEVIKKLMGM